MGGGESAKTLCLKRLQKSCSLCGARGNIDLELENSRAFYLKRVQVIDRVGYTL
jgi:hypothetical protein